MERGQIGGRQRYELRIVRRDGQTIHRTPHPVVEEFDVDDQRELGEAAGRHFIPMAAHAAERRVDPWDRVSGMQWWLAAYQLEIWRLSGSPDHPDAVSMSTEGWRD